MKLVKIDCDHCGADLTITGKMPKFRIVLDSEPVPHADSGYIFAVIVVPEIKNAMYFCDLGCLSGWLASNPRLHSTGASVAIDNQQRDTRASG